MQIRLSVLENIKHCQFKDENALRNFLDDVNHKAEEVKKTLTFQLFLNKFVF
jgi:hypothetical protein